MLGVKGQYGNTVIGSMFTMLKVRERTNGYDDPGWYQHPQGTVSYPAPPEQLRRDGIEPGVAEKRVPASGHDMS